jgi:hypothetical protein
MTQSNVNDSATNASTRTGSAQPRSGPVRYELIDKWARKHGPFDSAWAAQHYAAVHWPDQEQDPDRTGKGWDVQVEGAK